MILPYPIRLLCLGWAAFFLVHLLTALAISLIGPAAVARAERIKPRLGASFLLALRLFPAAFAGFVVVAFCVPSYFRLEPGAISERVGFVCLAAAVLGVAICGISAARVLRATAGSVRFFRNCVANETRLPGESSSVWIIDGPAPLVALTGVFKPRLVVSREVMSALSAEQLAAALRHEHAHRISRDNLKRLFVFLAPDVLPFVRTHGALDRSWAKLTEWAADDAAVAGNPHHSLSLAAALVRVARMGPAPLPSPRMASLVGNSRDLAARVERLLQRALMGERPAPRMPFLEAAAVLLLAAPLVALSLQPAVLSLVHQVLERLID